MKRKMACGLVIIAVLIVGLAAYAYAKPPKISEFDGIDGQKITLYSDNVFPHNSDEDVYSEELNPGDIIEGEQTKEIVIGISEDGRYITMPLEEYQRENGGS